MHPIGSTEILSPNAGGGWYYIRDGDARARAMFERHYSCRHYKDQRIVRRFVGPGEYIALMTRDAAALFVWRKFRPADGQQGINCAIFRNEGKARSSSLILAAEEIAWRKWPGARFYTYVNPQAVQSDNPGYCFKCAGWKVCGRTAINKLLILEKVAPCYNSGQC